jgi:tetratricopeptide (TPR) repeat protein
LSSQPLVYARLLDVIGQMSLHLARLDEAQHHLEQAVTIRRSARAAAVDVASSLIHLSWVYRNRNEYDHARKLVTEALDLRRAALPPGHVEIADALYELGWLATGSEQERLYREALVILSETAPANEQRVAILQALSTNLRRQGRLPDAVATDREAVALAERFFGADHHVTGYAMVHLADHIGEIEGDVVTAERLYRRGLELLASHFGENSVRLIHGLNSLAGLLASRGDNEAERHYRRALAIRQAITGPEHPRVADQLHELAGELARQGRLAEAETLARQALDLSIRTNGPRHQVIATARLPLLANVLDRARRYREADETYRAAFDQAPASPINVGQMHRAYGLMLLRRGEHARAETHLLQSLALLAQAYRGADHPNVQETKRGLMDLYGRLGDRAAVERHRVPPGRFIPY